MSFKNTILLFIALIILGGYVYFVEIKQHKKNETKTEESKQVFNVKKDSLEFLKIKNSYGTFILKMIRNEWQLTQPLATGADQSIVGSMVSNISSAKKDNEFKVQPPELANFGLGKRAISVEFRTRSGLVDSIHFGDKTPVGAFVFCNKNDSTIFTISEYIKNSYDKKLYDIRDKKLLHFKRENVRGLVLQTSYGKYEFEKDDQSNWQIQTIKRPADDSKLSSIVSKVEYDKAKEFVDEEGKEIAKFGLRHPKYLIQLDLGTERGKRLLAISKKMNGKYYAKDADRKPIFEVDSSVVITMNKKLAELRDPDFIDFERDQINRLKIEYNDTLLSMHQDTSKQWIVEGFETREVKSGKINSFFTSLKYTKISEFVKDGKFNPVVYGFNKPAVKISLFKKDNSVIEATLGKMKSDKIFATTNQYDSVYLISASKLKDFKLKVDDILEPLPVQAEAKSDSVKTE